MTRKQAIKEAKRKVRNRIGVGKRVASWLVHESSPGHLIVRGYRSMYSGGTITETITYNLPTTTKSERPQ